MLDAGIVDENVNRAKATDRLFDHVLNLVASRHVGCQ